MCTLRVFGCHFRCCVHTVWQVAGGRCHSLLRHVQQQVRCPFLSGVCRMRHPPVKEIPSVCFLSAASNPGFRELWLLDSPRILRF